MPPSPSNAAAFIWTDIQSYRTMAQVKLTLEMENFRQRAATQCAGGTLLPSRKLGIVCNGLEDQIMVKMAEMQCVHNAVEFLKVDHSSHFEYLYKVG